MSYKKYLLAPQGWRVWGDEWRYNFKVTRKKKAVKDMNLACFNPSVNVLQLNYFNYAPDAVDEWHTRSMLIREFKSLFNPENKPICIVEAGNSTPKKGVTYHIEYYVRIPKCPTLETLKKVEELLENPIL